MRIFFAFLLALVPSQTPSPSSILSTIVDGVEQSFARMNDYNSDFVQIFQGPLNRKQEEAGHVYLKRSRMMRWESKSPEETYFISDGKTVYFYVPADKQVNKESVKDTFDDRMPLMFLLGRSDLRSDFTSFALLNTKPFLEGTKVVRMTPKRKTDLKELIMEVDPANYQIRELRFTHSDGSQSEFIFSNIRINTGLKASLFDFKVPPGVQVVPGIGQ
jgi:outer membrane lipoprotein carrier protein